MDNNRTLFKQILQARYVLKGIFSGFRRVCKEPRLWLYSMAYLLLMWAACRIASIAATGPLAAMIASLYRIAFTFLFAAGGFVLLWMLGTPKGFLKISFAMTKVSDLSNAAGEIPVLISRAPTAGGHSEYWEFEAYGVPLSAFINALERLESALDIAIVTADTGNDGRKIVLTVVPHPGPWPKVLLWDISKMPLKYSAVALGENRGELITNDFSITPHLLLAGQTGSGKSVLLKIIMLQILHKGWQVYLADYKRGSDYGRNWETRCTLLTDDMPLLEALEEIRTEMERRLDLLHETDCPNIDIYNSKYGTQVPRIAICFDEIAEAVEKTSGMSKAEKERKEQISYLLSSLARLGRAAGVHLILATQRGSADVLAGQIRSNINAICGIANENLSLLILSTADAHKRIPKTARGRFIREDGTMFQAYYSDFTADEFNF